MSGAAAESTSEGSPVAREPKPVVLEVAPRRLAPRNWHRVDLSGDASLPDTPCRALEGIA